MALLRVLILCLLSMSIAVPSAAHHMGRTVPVAHSGEPEVEFAAQVVAAYFGEQMG